MNDLLRLLESCGGVRSLSLYQQDGLCWNKRGELRVTPALVAELRAAVEPQERYVCPIHGRQDGPDCARC